MKQHWFVRPEYIRILWRWFMLVPTATVLASTVAAVRAVRVCRLRRANQRARGHGRSNLEPCSAVGVRDDSVVILGAQ